MISSAASPSNLRNAGIGRGLDLAGLEEENRALRNCCNTFLGQIEYFKMQFERINQVNLFACQICASQQAHIENLESQNASQKERIEDMESQRASWQAYSEELESQNASWQEYSEGLVSQYNELNVKYEQLQRNFTELQQKSAALEEKQRVAASKWRKVNQAYAVIQKERNARFRRSY